MGEKRTERERVRYGKQEMRLIKRVSCNKLRAEGAQDREREEEGEEPSWVSSLEREERYFLSLSPLALCVFVIVFV